MTSVEARVKSLNTQMERVRRNMESLNNIAGQQAQVQKLAVELGTLQTDAASREAELDRLRESDLSLKQELDSLIESTQF
jgi:chromosome segregation ATPase